MASTVICGALSLGIGGVATAQDAPAAPRSSNASAVQEVVVTGTRLRSPNTTSLSPITALAGADFKATGATDAVDLLNALPQLSVGSGFNNTPNPLSNNGGFTTANLRNLGAPRTLVLVDGRRLMPGDPSAAGAEPDLDQIPSALVDRVDVMTGGASAVYGSDAVAGVVNFIMKHDFTGVQLDAQYGFDEHDNANTTMQGLERAFDVKAPSGSVLDGPSYNATLTLGANAPDDKGNLTVYGSYHNAQPVSQGNRDFSACQLSQSTGAPHCTGSSNSNLIADVVTRSPYNVSGSNFITNGDQTLTPQALFNSQPYEYLSRADERYLAGYIGHYTFNPHVDVYSDFAFMDDKSRFDVSPSGIFQQDGIFYVNCNNPLLSAQELSKLTCLPNPGGPKEAAVVIGRRNIEGGPRVYNFEHQSVKFDAGARGEIGAGWRYDAYVQYGRTNYTYLETNDLSISRIQNALQVAPNGQCLSGTSDGCVPYDIFQTGGVTPAALNYITASGRQKGDTEEEVVSGALTGDLGRWKVKSPYADNGVSVSAGVEYRREQVDLVPDATLLSGDLAGYGGAQPPVHGSFDVKEVFGEVGAPLVQGKPFVEDLSLAAGYRYSSYSLQGDTQAWKLGLSYTPDPQIRFRGGYNRAVRAPNVTELFLPPQITSAAFPNGDRCAPDATTGVARASFAACQRTGVTAAEYGNGVSPKLGGTDKLAQCPANQCSVVVAGNLALRPEISNTWSGGVVIAPRFIPNFSLSIDYFNVDVDGAIEAGIPATVIATGCMTTGLYCNLIVRNAQGSLFSSFISQGGYINLANINAGRLQTEGVDFNATYRFDLGNVGLKDKGLLAWRFDGSWVTHLNNEPVPGQAVYNCAGYYGANCSTPQTLQNTPNWRHQLTVTWQTPWNLSFMNRWRFIGGTRYEGNVGAVASKFDANDASLPDVSYWDMSVTWKARANLVLRTGVNNVLDTDPPLLDSGVVGTGLPNAFNTYDVVGRQIFMGLTANF